ncbi:unnamed protein product [Adineta steineri]|uniref:Reticulon-like protein n=1 Tax=Adineta steineri TaxID=433720 RepID=A0A813W7R1_9BILA|nr:unnamed protein product [Adineta steineri]
MDSQSHEIDSTTEQLHKTTYDDVIPPRYDTNETPTINSTNPDYNPPSTPTVHHMETNNPVVDSLNKGKTEFKRAQQQTEDIITKTKRIVKQHWDQTRHSLVQVQKKVNEMMPKEGNNLIYWRNPIQSGIVFGLSLSVIITFMFLSSLAAVSFWLLAFLVVIGLYKMYNYVMATFVGRVQDDIFDSIFPSDVTISERQAQAIAHAIHLIQHFSIFPSDVTISERQAQAIAHAIHVNGTKLLRHARNIFLWNNLVNSTLFGLVLFVFFYIGLSMNALTFTLVGLIFVFTVPKIYQVYQVPIDRTAKMILDQINQLLAKVTSKLPNKSKKA